MPTLPERLRQAAKYTLTDAMERLLIEAAEALVTPDSREVWPIVNVTVDETGKIIEAKQYAPGLPPGSHDVYPVKVPYMDEHTEAWLAVCRVLDETRPRWRDGPENGINCAIAAIRAPQTTEPMPLRRKSLTDDQIGAMFAAAAFVSPSDQEAARYFARAIEAAHGIKD